MQMKIALESTMPEYVSVSKFPLPPGCITKSWIPAYAGMTVPVIPGKAVGRDPESIVLPHLRDGLYQCSCQNFGMHPPGSSSSLTVEFPATED